MGLPGSPPALPYRLPIANTSRAPHPHAPQPRAHSPEGQKASLRLPPSRHQYLLWAMGAGGGGLRVEVGGCLGRGAGGRCCGLRRGAGERCCGSWRQAAGWCAGAAPRRPSAGGSIPINIIYLQGEGKGGREGGSEGWMDGGREVYLRSRVLQVKRRCVWLCIVTYSRRGRGREGEGERERTEGEGSGDRSSRCSARRGLMLRIVTYRYSSQLIMLRIVTYRYSSQLTMLCAKVIA